jgi:hypothetical protein
VVSTVIINKTSNIVKTSKIGKTRKRGRKCKISQSRKISRVLRWVSKISKQLFGIWTTLANLDHNNQLITLAVITISGFHRNNK